MIMKTKTILSAIGALASLSVLGSAYSINVSSASALEAWAQDPIQAEMVAIRTAPASGHLPVNLGTAAGFRILAKSGISTTGTTRIRGNLGVSPIDSTGITGFGLVMDPSGLFSNSSLVAGRILAPDYAAPTGQFLTTTVLDMEAAYTDAAGRTLPDFTELATGSIGGLNLTPGLYKWGTSVSIASNGITLSGNSTDVWIFQIAQDLTVSNNAVVTLRGGARGSRVFWQVAGHTTLGKDADFKGNILCKTKIVMITGAKLQGRALAQTAVTLDANALHPPN